MAPKLAMWNDKMFSYALIKSLLIFLLLLLFTENNVAHWRIKKGFVYWTNFKHHENRKKRENRLDRNFKKLDSLLLVFVRIFNILLNKTIKHHKV